MVVSAPHLSTTLCNKSESRELIGGAGYARRTNDPKDRRRTIVEPTQNKKWEKKLETIFTPLHEKMHKLLSSCSDSQLAFLLDVMNKGIELTREESKKLRQSRVDN